MTRYAFKVTLIGDGGVGKTSLRRRFMGQSFIANHLATIGADFSAEKIFLNGDEVEFQIWDLAGQQNFRQIRSRFYGGAKGSFCVFDLTKRSSFMNLPRWIEELYKNTGFGPVPIIIVGNKVDLDDQRVVSSEEAQKYVNRLNESMNFDIQYLETSAKTGENVRQAFNSFAKQLRDITVKEGEVDDHVRD